MKYTMSTNKLQSSIDRLDHFLKNEKSFIKAKQLKITNLEQQISKLEKDPNNSDLVKKILKEKDKEIVALKKTQYTR